MNIKFEFTIPTTPVISNGKIPIKSFEKLGTKSSLMDGWVINEPETRIGWIESSETWTVVEEGIEISFNNLPSFTYVELAPVSNIAEKYH